MDLTRYYFISTDLDDLDHVEVELEKAGIAAPQIHVLTRENASLERHSHLQGVPSMMKRDAVHSALIGASVGIALAIASLLISYMAGWTDSGAGWLPPIFLAAVLLGFSTWFGGMHGLRLPNRRFERFQKMLDDGKHILFVDIDYSQEQTLKSVCDNHPTLEWAGNGGAMPAWLVSLENSTSHWWYWRMWRAV